MHPGCPALQRGPPRLMTMWPISPAAPRPSHGLPLSTRPPPTPVPQKTPSTDLYGFPAPNPYSALTATCTSLPTPTGVPSDFERFSASGNEPSQPGRLRAFETAPVFSSASPGEPTPTPFRSLVASPAASAASLFASAIAPATSSGPPSVGVGLRASPSTLLRALTTTVWILV